MNWTKKEVPSLELCKSLKDLGYPQEGGRMFWIVTEEDNDKMLVLEANSREPFEWLDRREGELAIGDLEWKNSYKVIEIIKAPTVAELGERLPYEINCDNRYHILTTLKFEDKYVVCYLDKYHKNYPNTFIKTSTEANSRAKMWLYLKKNNLVKEAK